MNNETITAIEGLRVGHATDAVARTGCTVILCEAGATAGVDVRGSSPGTRETDIIRPGKHVEKVHAILLTGGSAFGLDAAGGVMQYLEERGVGYPAGPVRVPIVPAAVIFDLAVGDAQIRPDRTMGYRACLRASNAPVECGRVGAGTGATVGKVAGYRRAKAGLGSALRRTPSGLFVGAIVVANAIGNVVDPATGRVIAGATHPETGEIAHFDAWLSEANTSPFAAINTVIGAIATNAALSPAQATKVAEMGHDGLALAVRPAHTMHDGDTFFALATGEREARLDVVAMLAVRAVSDAILNAVTAASGPTEPPGDADADPSSS